MMTLAFLLQEREVLRLTAGTMTFMILAMGAVTTLTAWCFYRILKGRRHFDPDGTGPAQPPVRGKLEREKGAGS
jgi:hypothetical protein